MQRLLFHGTSIFDILESQKQRLTDTVRAMSQSDLKGDEATLILDLVDKYSINVPVLNENDIYMTKRDVDIDYTHNRSMAFNYGTFGAPLILRGVEVTVHVPFVGDAALFGVQPTHFTTNPPRGEVVGSELQLVYQVRPEDTSLKKQYEESLQQVKQHLGWLHPSAQQLAVELKQLAESLVSKRRLQHEAQTNVVASLGLPIREVSPHAASPVKADNRRSTPQQKKVEQKWDVFISHASEDQDEIARPLAAELKERGLRVWFAEFSLTVGDSLRQSIDWGLASSRFGIVILSKYFFEKHWPQQELNGLATREVDGKKVILPVWHNVTVDEIRDSSPMLADRLGVDTEKGLPHVVQELLRAIAAG